MTSLQKDTFFSKQYQVGYSTALSIVVRNFLLSNCNQELFVVIFALGPTKRTIANCNIKNSTWWWSKHMNKRFLTHVTYILYKLTSFLLFLKSSQPLTNIISMRKLRSFLLEAYNYNRALLCIESEKRKCKQPLLQ